MIGARRLNMYKKYIFNLVLVFGVMGFLFTLASCDSDNSTTAQDLDSATIRVQNLTVGQPFGPTVVIVHNSNYRLFENGEAASEGLEALAEDAFTEPLVNEAEANPDVLQVFVGDGIPPLQSGEVDIEFTPGFNQVSVAQMLTNTNDAFYAARNLTIPASGSTLVRVPAYDAGTEPDDENCENIPGPACGGGRGAPTSNGLVYISNGVFGEVNGITTDLDNQSLYDWRNPVADVSVSR